MKAYIFAVLAPIGTLLGFAIAFVIAAAEVVIEMYYKHKSRSD